MKLSLLIKLVAGLATLGFTIWAIYRQNHRPFGDFNELRTSALKAHLEGPFEKLRQQSNATSLRINVMAVSKKIKIGNWYHRGLLMPIFQHGGAEYELDNTFCFLYRRWFKKHPHVEGVCGAAFFNEDRIKTSFGADIHKNKWNLTARMKRETKHLNVIISFPVAQKLGRHTFRYVGVINIDSDDKEFADRIQDETQSAEFWKALAQYTDKAKPLVAKWL